MAGLLKKLIPITKKRWIPPLLPPVIVLVVIPAIILWLTGYRWKANHHLLLDIGWILLLCGMAITAWAMRLFHSAGHGTTAPWDPPQRLVVAGPYRHVRNPMLISIFIMQFAEALLLNSWAIFIFLLVFVAVSTLAMLFREEKQLERRFGDAYREYRRNVPRWIPRLRPWRPR